MLSLHQLRCFLATYEHGSLTAAADELGYAQPSVSEQVRALEKSLGVPLFRRVGRGVVPTTLADTLRPHAEQTIAAAEEARRAVQSAVSLESGTIRFGMFGVARLYAGAAIVAEVLDRYPGVRVELIGQHSNEVQDQLRRGRLEAAMIAVANAESEGMTIIPVSRDELVYISADPERLTTPVTAARLSQATLVMSETTWRTTDSFRVVIRRFLHEAGHNPQHPDRGRGDRDRGGAGRPRLRRLGDPSQRGRAADPAAGTERRLRVAAPQAVRRDGGRAPRRRRALACRSGDDRGGDQAHPDDH